MVAAEAVYDARHMLFRSAGLDDWEDASQDCFLATAEAIVNDRIRDHECNGLPVREKEILERHYLDGDTQKDVMLRMCLSDKQYGNLKFRALERLRARKKSL